MPELTIAPLVVPVSIDDENAAEFIEYSGVLNEVLEASIEADDFFHEPVEELPEWRIPGHFCEGLVARLDGRMVGAARYAGQDSSLETHASVEVLPEFRRQGIGTALLARVLERARNDGRLTLQGHLFDTASDAGPRVNAASGTGSIRAASPGLAFVLAQGGALEQVGRVSRVTLPLAEDMVREQDELARQGYAERYELVRWEGRTPAEYLDDIAVLMTRMSTDTPSAGLETSEDVWDAARTSEMEREFESSPRRRLVVAAREVATGRLVGYTQLDVPAETNRPVDQWATLVLREHRGHRLGLALKLENLVYLNEVLPGHPSVMTINATENAHMLAVNEAVGFAAIGYEGSVQLTLPA